MVSFARIFVKPQKPIKKGRTRPWAGYGCYTRLPSLTFWHEVFSHAKSTADTKSEYAEGGIVDPHQNQWEASCQNQGQDFTGLTQETKMIGRREIVLTYIFLHFQDWKFSLPLIFSEDFLFSVSFALPLSCCHHLPRQCHSVPHISQALCSSSVREEGIVMGISLIMSHPWSLPEGCPKHTHWQTHTSSLGFPETSVSQG